MRFASKRERNSNAVLSRQSHEKGNATSLEQMLSQFSIPRIVLLSNDVMSSHEMRRVIRSAGITANLDLAASREDFLESFEHRPVDLIVISDAALSGFEIFNLLELADAASGPIPILVLADDSNYEDVQKRWNSHSAQIQVVPASRFDRLPSIVERLLRGRRNQSANARLKDELDRAADILRENQKLIVIGRLAASIAHEINNPLESITNLLYLMESERDSPEKLAGYLGLAQRELNRVVQISKQTLTFSRETSSPLNTQLSDLIEEVLTLYGRKIAAKELRVIREYQSTEKVTVFPGEMRQVLSNLIANAIEATEAKGTLMVRIRTTRNWSDQGVQGIRLSIADSGVGMPASVRRRLGEPFFTTKGQHGTGLGLWVTRSILHRYGGALQLRSSVNPKHHGTVFSMFLPTNMRPQMVQPKGGPAPFAGVAANENETPLSAVEREALSHLDSDNNDSSSAGSKQRA